MKRWTLIAALAILAVVGIGTPLTANAHDGPVAVLDAAPPANISAELAVSLDYWLSTALVADLNVIALSGGAERIERADYSNVRSDVERRFNLRDKDTPEQRSRDVPGDVERA